MFRLKNGHKQSQLEYLLYLLFTTNVGKSPFIHTLAILYRVIFIREKLKITVRVGTRVGLCLYE